MDNRTMYKEISRLSTSDLLVFKMDYTRSIFLFKSLKLGLVGLSGIFVGHIIKPLISGQALAWVEYISAVLALYCVSGHLILDAWESSATALKELIVDLLAIRMSRAGKKS
ncbi:hypothetical protein [Pelagibaculum spongiae]|uniref:Uncharacterized protein n=1 Tax=Pelagibaculum spongiae TaxID=2080658 RepID=A0A2V1GR41_9GAMM|nr:hypothetical protein [Pelagibaculum spongiae]PVZ64542.1 hypothetical protein DC094_19720 [Pelagibaculum spongiae]